MIGNPLETSFALAHLIFEGTLDRFPNVRICGAHGGGYFPFYIGRFDHGWRVRPEAKTCRQPPSEYLKRLWFDALVFDPEQLAYLIRVEVCGAAARSVASATRNLISRPAKRSVEQAHRRLSAWPLL